MVLLLTTLTPLVNKFVTDASLVLTTLNIVWLFYIAILGYTKRRSHYLLVVTVLVFVPFLYRSYLSSSPSLDLTWFQPGYFLLLFGYLIVSLFRRELTSRQYAEKEIQRVYRELDQVRLGEIQHIGRNLHDQLGNTLASALGYLNMRKPNIALSKAMILDAISETRLISHNLVKNDDRPLTEKLEALTDRFNDFSSIDFVFHDFTDKKIDLVPGIKQQSIYLIVQEVLNNVVRHSQANETMIQSLIVDDHLRVSIEDDGIGFDRTAVPNGIGITNMYKRADIAALRLHINGGPGGTLINIDLDYEAQGL